MAYELHRDDHSAPKYTASNIATVGAVVKLSASQADYIVPVGSQNERPFGFVDHVASVGDHVSVYEDLNYVKARAAASVGVGAAVTVASANGALGPVAGGPTAVASGTIVWEFGESHSAAAAGGIFTVRIRPRAVAG